jgi:hypothetical protein
MGPMRVVRVRRNKVHMRNMSISQKGGVGFELD